MQKGEKGMPVFLQDIRIGIDQKQSEAVSLVATLVEHSKVRTKHNAPRATEQLDEFREVLATHCKLMRPRELESFMLITKHYEALDQHVRHLRDLLKCSN